MGCCIEVCRGCCLSLGIGRMLGSAKQSECIISSVQARAEAPGWGLMRLLPKKELMTVDGGPGTTGFIYYAT
jgi:hypothetical protein